MTKGEREEKVSEIAKLPRDEAIPAMIRAFREDESLYATKAFAVWVANPELKVKEWLRDHPEAWKE